MLEEKKLTFGERLILSNQLAILKIIDRKEAEQYEQAEEIVNCGYEHLYGEINPFVFEPFPKQVADEVVAILDMHRSIERSCRLLDLSPSELGVSFQGFLSTCQEGHYGFAWFLRRQQGKWEELSQYPDDSSIVHSLGLYRGMLARWNALGRKSRLTQAEMLLVSSR